MLSHLLRPQIEADATQKGTQALALFRFHRTRNRILWAVFVTSVTLAFIVVLVSIAISNRHVPASRWIYVGIAAAAAIAFIGEHFRIKLSFLNQQTRNAYVWTTRLTLWLNSDFLFPHTLATYALVVMPALLTALFLALFSTGWTKPGT